MFCVSENQTVFEKKKKKRHQFNATETTFVFERRQDIPFSQQEVTFPFYFLMFDILSFDVDPETGFLPPQLPLERLPQAYYAPWENLVNNLPALLLASRVRPLVDKLPALSTEQLSSPPEYRRAYMVLGFLAHAYVWGTNEPVSRLPENLARPLVEVSDVLGLPPLATYAGLCLWNFKEIIPTTTNTKDVEFDNLTTINTFTGSIDEQWFFLVSVFFEARGARAVRAGMDAIKHAQNKDSARLIASLQQLAQVIDHLGSVMMRMEEMCDPHVFYFRLRPYLAGWKNMADVGLDKNGVIYGNEEKPRAYAGGSNAQSLLIQFLDSVLSVHHYATGERPAPHQKVETSEKPESAYLREMRNYMPGSHREFLAMVDRESCIREYVMANQENAELTLSYDACLAMLKLFRDKHIQIVTRYVVLQAKQAPKMGSLLTLRSGLAKKKRAGTEEKGTGGTSLLPFLKQCRDETGDPAAGSWGKRLLSDGVMRLNYSKANAINED